jgi:uncharacterized protein (TIGR00369 family)
MTEHLPYSHHCFVCGVDNPHGLKLRFTADAGEVLAVFDPQAQHAGYRGILHGGVVAAALDEAMFWAASHAGGRFHMSGEMTVRDRRKVLVGERYELSARPVDVARGVYRAEGELRDAEGRRCATATGKYLPLPVEDVPAVLEDFHPDAGTVPPERYVKG